MNDERIARNMERIKALRSKPTCTELRLQLSDDELRLISINPSKCNPSGIWREGREFHLVSHGKATWAGGGWWDICGPNRRAIDTITARLISTWFPPPVQKELLLPKPERSVASRDVAAAALAKCREIMARPK
jgi:hypothetical protein